MFQSFIETRKLLTGTQGVLVAYSGGPDSTCLLHLFSKLNWQIVAAHLNHQQRQESVEEQKMCQAFCESIGVPFLAGSADVPALSKALGIGIEEAGRKARYEFLRNLVGQLGDFVIATGHTLDDRVETVFLHMARGSGMRGMVGISPKRDGIIRPLLWARRHQTLEYCVQQGLPYILDPFNEDESYARVRVRQRISPIFESLNSKAFEHVGKLADLAAEEDAFMDAIAVHALVDSEIKEGGLLAFLTRHLEVFLDAQTLRERNVRVVIRRALKLLGRPLHATFDFDQIETIVDAIEKQYKAAITAEEGAARIVVNDRRIHAYRNEPVVPYWLTLQVPGEVTNDSIGWHLSATLGQKEDSPLCVIVNRRALRGGLVVRQYQPGDRIHPFEHAKEKKLKELFDKAEFRKMTRERLPIVADDAGPIWVPGIAVAARVASCQKEEPITLKLAPSQPSERYNPAS